MSLRSIDFGVSRGPAAMSDWQPMPLADAKNIADFPGNWPSAELRRAHGRLLRTQNMQTTARGDDRLDRRLNRISAELARRGDRLGMQTPASGNDGATPKDIPPCPSDPSTSAPAGASGCVPNSSRGDRQP